MKEKEKIGRRNKNRKTNRITDNSYIKERGEEERKEKIER